jgi:hypothetical protein
MMVKPATAAELVLIKSRLGIPCFFIIGEINDAWTLFHKISNILQIRWNGFLTPHGGGIN